MKKSVLFTLCTFLSFVLFAQTTIPNGGFENWQNTGTATEEPTNWNSNKTGGGNANLGPQTCFREATNPHTGTYCARVKSGSTFGVVVNGSLATGKIEAPSTNKAEGYIQTIPSDPNYAASFTGRPDSLVFWIRYSPVGSDYIRLQANLHEGSAHVPEAPVNGNHPNNSANVIARATYLGTNTTISNWTRISIPFVYVDNRTPQYILITSTPSGDQLGGSANSTMWIDDVEAIYNPKVNLGTIATGPFYVSPTQGASISIPYTLQGTFAGANVMTAQLSNNTGSFASPINIGTLSSNANGNISATIPAGTPSGTAYRIRATSSSPSLTSADNGNNIEVILVQNSVSPAATQNLVTNTPGSTLSVTESPGVISRGWSYSSTPGGPYTSFSPAQTGTSWSPVFSTPGTYYVICTSVFPSGLTVESNEVMFTVSGNSIAPNTSQVILANVNGNTLTVTETPAGTSREWKFATTSGGPYSSFSPAQTGLTYTPNFATTGSFYIVCESQINAIAVTSNQVLVTVGSLTLNTGVITGSPFLFSASAPDASVNVPYTTSGTYSPGNVFTAQLSDALGSFASPVNIGSVTSVSTGTISASIPSSTASGTMYRIRVVSSNPVLEGTNNGTDLVVNQYSNSVSPATTQTLAMNTNGTMLTVSESQPTLSREWKYSSTSGSGYLSFSPPKTAATYTPNFLIPGTYHVVCTSRNSYNDEVISNEVQIVIQNGTIINTGTVIGSPFRISNSAVVQSNISFTTNAVFTPSNVFTAQISDENGSFTNPTTIGTLNGATVTWIPCTIPNSLSEGTAYRIRVVSSDPPIIGNDNGVNLQVLPFRVNIASTDTQYLLPAQSGNQISATSTHASSYRWMYSFISGSFYQNVSPANTTGSYFPSFVFNGTYHIVCEGVNQWTDTVLSNEVVVVVGPVSTNDELKSTVKIYQSGNELITDLISAEFGNYNFIIRTMDGREVMNKMLEGGNRYMLPLNLPKAVYIFELNKNETKISDKIRLGF